MKGAAGGNLSENASTRAMDLESIGRVSKTSGCLIYRGTMTDFNNSRNW